MELGLCLNIWLPSSLTSDLSLLPLLLPLGAEVSKTIASKIVDVTEFANLPQQYMLGMFSSLLGGASTVGVATVFGLPVSTTHAVIGAVAGFAVVEQHGAVLWYPEMLRIVVSWGE